MHIDSFFELIDRYQAGTATAKEQETVETYYERLTQGRTELTPEEEERLRTVVLKKIVSETKPKTIPMFRRLAAAAAVLVVFASGGWLLFHNGAKEPLTAKVNDIAPGKTGSILRMQNGKIIIVDTAAIGQLSNNISKASTAIMVEASDGPIEYATLETPKARTEVLRLPDGTEVTLNASSSIRFPLSFKGNERVVEVTGEAYFKVTHNAKMPFKVKVGNETIEDIGTEFNVNAYTDEPAIKTTLIQGSVKINNAVLKPGQQYLNGKIIEADTELETAWVNGIFMFHKTSIESVMNQLSRWYDVTIHYSPGTKEKTFTGQISKYSNASKVIEMLEATGGAHFKIVGNGIEVLP